MNTAPAGMVINLGRTDDVAHVGTAGEFAWIRFASGMRIEMTREQLVAIVAGFGQQMKVESILAQLSN